jgi:hypothetical protein
VSASSKRESERDARGERRGAKWGKRRLEAWLTSPLARLISPSERAERTGNVNQSVRKRVKRRRMTLAASVKRSSSIKSSRESCARYRRATRKRGSVSRLEGYPQDRGKAPELVTGPADAVAIAEWMCKTSGLDADNTYR